MLKTTPAEIEEKIAHLQAEVKALHSENESLKAKMVQDAVGDVMSQVQEIKGVKLLATALEDVDMNGLRDLGDQLKEKTGRRRCCSCQCQRRKSKPSRHGYRPGSESRRSCRKPDQRNCGHRRRRRRRTPEYGSGRRQESGKSTGSIKGSRGYFGGPDKIMQVFKKN